MLTLFAETAGDKPLAFQIGAEWSLVFIFGPGKIGYIKTYPRLGSQSRQGTQCTLPL